MRPDPAPQDRPVRDLALYEELIRHGIEEADGRCTAIDPVTARRMAIWLLPRSQEEPESLYLEDRIFVPCGEDHLPGHEVRLPVMPAT